MTKKELNTFKKTLAERIQELENVMRRRDEIAIEKSADALDEVQRAEQRELAIRNLDRETNLLRETRSALARLEKGTFGSCLICDK
jgi:DnaK suppressor protein